MGGSRRAGTSKTLSTSFNVTHIVQIQQLDFVRDQKRWAAEKARQAPELNDDIIEEFTQENSVTFTTSDNQMDATQLEQEMSEVDYILAQEEQEMQALIASMETETQNENDTHDAASQHYGSDDEAYDQIFMEYTPTSETNPHHGAMYTHIYNAEDMNMDTTDG
jgi:hypothetical protein